MKKIHLRATSHSHYIEILPTVSIGKKWIILGWLFWTVDIYYSAF